MKIESIYKHFMLTPVPYLPVIDSSESFIGLISKQKVIMDMADLSLQGIEYDTVPEHFLDFHINEALIYYFQNHRTIPVLNQKAEKVGAWEKPRFLAEVSKFTKQEIKEEPIVEEKPKVSTESEARQTIYKFIETILECFPDALYATDKEGRTTFFNELFEDTILKIPFFKDSISFAEKYFRDLNRDLISNYFRNNESQETLNPLNIPSLQVYVQNLQKIVRVITLKSENKVIGFLYHFINPKNNFITDNNSRTFPSLELAFTQGIPLEDIVFEVESSYIFNSLKSCKNNISHTAAMLGVPRSTLQNKIKQLKLHEKYPYLNSQLSQEQNKNESSSEIFNQKELDNNLNKLDKSIKQEVSNPDLDGNGVLEDNEIQVNSKSKPSRNSSKSVIKDKVHPEDNKHKGKTKKK